MWVVEEYSDVGGMLFGMDSEVVYGAKSGNPLYLGVRVRTIDTVS